MKNKEAIGYMLLAYKAPVKAIPTDLLTTLEGHTSRNLKEIRGELQKRKSLT